MRVESVDFSVKNVAKKLLVLSVAWLCACTEPPPPPTVDDFMNDSVLLDATMVRCSADRATTKYEPECVNAREAINRVARAEEAARRAELEKQSERKRRALRRTQEAAATARRRADEAARQRAEEEYLAQFEPLTGEPASETSDGEAGQAPAAAPSPDAGSALPPSPAPNAENATTTSGGEPEAPAAAGDESPSLDDIRQELQRRQGEGQQ